MMTSAVQDLYVKARQGEKEAQFALAVHLMQQRNTTEALQWFERAANQGYSQAKLELAKYYAKLQVYDPRGAENYFKAASYFIEVVETCPEASNCLKPGSDLYQKLYNMASGTTYTHTPEQALYLLGCIHTREEFQCINSEKAVDFYTRAAQKRHLAAAKALGNIYYSGQLSITKDKKKALYWFEHAYRYCNRDAEACEYLGRLHSEGQEGVPVNLDEAIRFYQMAERLGNQVVIYELGVTYYKKMTSPNLPSYHQRDYRENAINYLNKAIKSIPSKKSQAYNYLGLVYYNMQEWVKAEPFFLAAAQELSYAQYNAAILYHHKLSPPQRDKAIQWYRKAAENQYAKAEYELACFYETGCAELPQDLLQAFLLFNRAAEHGWKAAEERLSQPGSPFIHLKKVYTCAGADLTRWQQYVALEKALGYEFKEFHHLICALSRKMNPESAEAEYQRYEFVGDRIVNMAVASYLERQASKEWNVKRLDQASQLLVSNARVTEIAKQLELQNLIALDDSEKAHPITDKMLADAGEALIGAITKDGGITDAEKAVIRLWGPHLEQALTPAPVSNPVASQLSSLPSMPIRPKLNRTLSPGSLGFFNQFAQMSAQQLKTELEQHPHRAQIQNQGKNGDTPLILAVKQLHGLRQPKKLAEKISKVELLLNAGATWAQPNRKGKTPDILVSELDIAPQAKKSLQGLGA